jgi:hypothetical protein
MGTTPRPDKPLEFMADYFSNALQGRTAVARSYRYIRLTRRNRQAFLDNLAAAYSVLARQGEAPASLVTLAAVPACLLQCQHA